MNHLLKLCLNFTFVLLLYNQVDGGRILAVFPTPSISHQVVFRPLTQELARRGHHLVIITPDPAFPNGKAPKNVREIDVHSISYEVWEEKFKRNVDSKSNFDEILRLIYSAIPDVVEKQIQSAEIQSLIQKKEEFDLLLIEACIRPALVFSYVFKSPVIQISSFGNVMPNFEMIGTPLHPTIYPETISSAPHNLSTWGKLNVIWEYLKLRTFVEDLEEYENDMLRRVFGPEVYTVDKLYKNVEMLFLNTYHIWHSNRPVPPGVVYIGGIYQVSQQVVTQDLRSFLDKSNKGIIYMSFGTNVHPSLLLEKRINIFLNVFKKLPYNVILKWDQENLLGKPENVKILKWLPQNEILQHSKMKIFITQAGLQSTEEAILAGVPMIAIPLIADQYFNAEKYVHFDIGIKLNLESVTEQILEESIADLITNNSKYRQNIVKLRSVMLDQPQPALQRAVWWTEYVMRHGGARHLRAPMADVTWAEYLMLDVVIVVGLGLTMTPLIFITIILFIVKKIKSIMNFATKLKTS